MKTLKSCIFLLFAIVLISSCSTPPERIIKYTTNDNCKIEFKDNKFGNATLVSNVYSEEEQCFYAIFDQTVKTIGAECFIKCETITSVTIPNSVTIIGEDAFSDCSRLKEVHISDLSAWCGIDFESYSANPLYYAHNLYLNGELVTDLVIPDGVTEIKNGAFDGCSGLKSITIPNSVTSIGNSAFSDCFSLTGVTIGNSVTTIGGWAFSGCTGLTSITIPNSVTSIGDYAFIGCSGLTSVVIPNSVTSIGSFAFEDCSGLTSVTIPNNVTSIGDGAFPYRTKVIRK